MPQQFDATLKDLVQAHPADWVALLGGSVAGPIEVLTPDLSTVSAFADVVLRLPGGVLHLDFQSGPDPDVSSRMLLCIMCWRIAILRSRCLRCWFCFVPKQTAQT
jgi:predicted transposase YdaD